MKNTRRSKIQIIIAGLVGLSLLIVLFPILEMGDLKCSALDLSLRAGKILDQLGDMEFIEPFVKPYMDKMKIWIILAIAVPLIETVCICLSKGKTFIIVSLAAIVINNGCIFKLVYELNKLIDYMDDMLEFFGWEGLVKVPSVTIVVWVILYILIACLLIRAWYVEQFQKKQDTRISSIMPEDIISVPKTVAGKRTVSEREREVGAAGVTEYNGAIIDKSGLYHYKVLPMKKGEEIIFGAAGCENTVTLDEFLLRECCSVRYNWEKKEYWLQASEVRLVYLESGQPLGRNRLYCLPRGSVVYFKDKKNVFQLG